MGWSPATFTSNRSYLVKKEGVRSNARAGMKTPLSLCASVRPPSGDAGSRARVVCTSTATTRPTSSGNRRKAEKVQVGLYTRDPRLVFARYRALPASGDRNGSGNGASSAKSSKGDDEQGCGLRQLAGPTSAAGRARVSEDDAQLVRPKMVPFSQPGAELGASGCSSLYKTFGHQSLP